MEPSQETEDNQEWSGPRDYGVLDDTIVLVGLLLMRETLFKSGYPADVIVELQDRLQMLIRTYTRKGY